MQDGGSQSWLHTESLWSDLEYVIGIVSHLADFTYLQQKDIRKSYILGCLLEQIGQKSR